MQSISNHTACHFAEKARFFRLLRAGRRCAAASRFAFSKVKRSSRFPENRRPRQRTQFRCQGRLFSGKTIKILPHLRGTVATRKATEFPQRLILQIKVRWGRVGGWGRGTPLAPAEGFPSPRENNLPEQTYGSCAANSSHRRRKSSSIFSIAVRRQRNSCFSTRPSRL